MVRRFIPTMPLPALPLPALPRPALPRPALPRPAMPRPAMPIAIAFLAILFGACSSSDAPPPSLDKGLPPDGARDAGRDSVGPDQRQPDLAGNKPPAGAILVSPVGQDTPTCGATKDTACATIAQGILRARAYQPPRPVALAGGTYLETVTLASGLKLLGGYNSSFEKLGGGNKTAVIKGVLTGGEAVAVIAENLPDETVIDGVEIEAPQPIVAGKSSYGVIANNAPRLVLRNCTISARDGLAGLDGQGTATVAADGKPGTDGTAGANFDLFVPQPLVSCSIEAPRSGFPGKGGAAVTIGLVTCGKAGGKGGQAGVDTCKGGEGGSGGVSGNAVTSCTAARAGRGGTGGSAGLMNTTTCVGDPTGGSGGDGCDGRDGTSGAAGAGGKHRVIGGYFVPSNGEAGKDGVNDATGGGGGGGGGGGDCAPFGGCLGKCIADYGGGGGGGGSAGCSGKAGSGGTSGGGSFAVFIVKSAATIRIEGCKLSTGNGGRGGDGGKGQAGGKGGSSGKGGPLIHDSGDGGNGGRGGNGGSGGHGGGGAGGPSVGIYIADGASPTVSGTTYQLGAPGKGGSSLGNAGEDGFQKDIARP